jgi:bile acid:Na+ symporter, BASS family
MERALHWIQRRLVWLLLSTYVFGAFAPALGLRLRAVQLGKVEALGSAGAFTLPMLMVGVLLFVAGLGARLEALEKVIRRPALLVVGLTANVIYPVAFTALVAVLLLGWHSHDDAQNLLVGLAMIGAMPIAGASTTWSQNADGNLALSLGLVWGSTLLSPVLTPLVLHVVAFIAHGERSADLRELALNGSSAFVVLVVVVPSLCGIAGQAVMRRTRLARWMPGFRMLSLIDLLGLSYVNAAVSLPQAVNQPDPRYLVLVLASATVMCAGAFGMGWWIPRRLGAPRGDQTALMFGLGMSNNGASLVLAQAALPQHPRVLLSIIAYNLIQQLAAGLVDMWRRPALALDQRRPASSWRHRWRARRAS